MMNIGAIILAAGLSTRMGRPKVLLPWKGTTIIESILSSLRTNGIEHVVVVTGALHDEISSRISGYQAKTVHNPNYQNGEMLSSFQSGLNEFVSTDIYAVLLMLGDQPQINSGIISDLLSSYTNQRILIPSYQMRRGHPWIIHRSFWAEILSMKSPMTLRDFLQKHAAEIEYEVINDPRILQDIDTPEDYQRMLSGAEDI